MSNDLLLADVLARLGERAEDPVFLGGDRITRGEFARLVYDYAGGLRARGARSLALIASMGPTTLALLLAAIGMGVRIDLISPKGGTELVQGRLDAARPDVVVAEPLLKFALKGPKWVRTPLGLPNWRIWPEIVSIDDLGGAQVRRFGIDPDAAALTVFTSGTTAEPNSAVHTPASLSAGMTMARSLFDERASGPVFAGTFFAMLPALAAGIPILRPASNPKRLARQLAKWRPSHTYLMPHKWRGVLAAGARLTGRAFADSAPVTSVLLRQMRAAGAVQAYGVYGMAEAFPAAVVESADKPDDDRQGDHVGQLFDGVEARIEDGEVILSGTSMAPRMVEGGWREEVHTGDLGHLSGRNLWLHGRQKDWILRRSENIYPGLYEPRLAVIGVDIALLLGLPSIDGDEQLVLLAQASGKTDKAKRALERKTKELGLPVDAIVFDEVPMSPDLQQPDRSAARELVARRVF